MLPHQAELQPDWITGTICCTWLSLISESRSAKHSEMMSEQLALLGFQQPQLSVNAIYMFFYSRHRILIFNFGSIFVSFIHFLKVYR